MKGISFDIVVSLMTGIFVCLIVLPMFALFTSISLGELANQFKSPYVLSSFLISIETSLAVVFLALCLGVPTAYLLGMKKFRGKEIIDTLIDLPICMPPLVAGLALLILLGGDSGLGNFLSNQGIDLIFSKKGIIIAHLFVSTPFLIKSAREAFESINQNLINASLTLGASKFYTFKKVLLPLARNGIHVDGLLKNPLNYEPYEPSEVCLERKLLVGKKTGTNALRHKLNSLGVDAEDHLLKELLKIVKKESSRLKTSLTDEELLHLYSIQREALSSQD